MQGSSIDTLAEFKSLFKNVKRQLDRRNFFEKKGYFHRRAQQFRREKREKHESGIFIPKDLVKKVVEPIKNDFSSPLEFDTFTDRVI
jgi:hypothetical protein